jgi:hypothetical protein
MLNYNVIRSMIPGHTNERQWKDQESTRPNSGKRLDGHGPYIFDGTASNVDVSKTPVRQAVHHAIRGPPREMVHFVPWHMQ